VTLHQPAPSQPEGDWLTADLTNPLSLSDANTERVVIWPVPNLAQSVGRRERQAGRIAPSIG
jgi:hypothetical protein